MSAALVPATSIFPWVSAPPALIHALFPPRPITVHTTPGTVLFYEIVITTECKAVQGLLVALRGKPVVL